MPLAIDLQSRDGKVDRYPKIVNGIVEVVGEGKSFVKRRSGMTQVGTIGSAGQKVQHVTSWNGLRVVVNDSLYSGSLSSIFSSPVATALSPSVTGQQYDSANSGPEATTQVMMLKNRTNAWKVNKDGSVASITYGASMGSYSYPVTSLTRSGTTATAVTPSDVVFKVGDTVTIAGATPSAYNGAQVVTAVTYGKVTPARTIAVTITRSGTTATATTADGTPHGLTTATSYAISGANEAAYNGTFTITVTSATTFTFTVTVTPATTVTLNPSDKAASVTLSGSNMIATVAASNQGGVRATSGKSSGKWYWEVTIGGASASHSVGISNSSETLSGEVGNSVNGWGYRFDAVKLHGTAAYYGAGFSVGDVIGIALDLDSGTIEFFKNGVSQGVAFTGVSGTVYPAVFLTYNAAFSTSATFNFGATSFSYSAPTGFSSYQVDSPAPTATGAPVITDPAVTINSSFTFTIGGSPTTPATGTITASVTGGTVPGIVYLDGVFYVMDVNGVVYNSAEDDPATWDALNYTKARQVQGSGAAIGKSGPYLVAIKEFSTEFFYDAANATGSPLSPAIQFTQKVGSPNGRSLADVGGSLLFVSQTKDGKKGVHMVTGTTVSKVSNDGVDVILGITSLVGEDAVRAVAMSMHGHPVYVLQLNNYKFGNFEENSSYNTGITLVYDLVTQLWHEWQTMVSTSTISSATVTRVNDTATLTVPNSSSWGSVQAGPLDGGFITITVADQKEYTGLFQVARSATLSVKFPVSGNPTTPASGLSGVGFYSGSTPFQVTHGAMHSGQFYAMSDLATAPGTNYVYQQDPVATYDKTVNATLPIVRRIRTEVVDGGTVNRKKMTVLRVVGEQTQFASCMVRVSDDFCASWEPFQRIELDTDEPEVYRMGSFRRRVIEVLDGIAVAPNLEALEYEITL